MALAAVGIGVKTSGRSAWLDAPAAESYKRMLRAGCPGGCITDAGRTYTEQAELWRQYLAGLLPATAAPPGTSKHESGRALDLAEPARSWVRAHGADYGWIKDRVRREPWHLEYQADRDRHAGPAKPDSTPTPTPPADSFGEDDTMHERAIIAAYRKHLGRVPGATEVDDRILRIATGETTLAQELAGIATSSEAKRWPVVQLYRKLLGRTPSAAESDHWLTETGGDLARIEAGIKGSAEYKSKH